MQTPAQRKKQYVKTPEYRAAALRYSVFIMVVGLILASFLAFLINRAETREMARAEQEALDAPELSKESTP